MADAAKGRKDGREGLAAASAERDLNALAPCTRPPVAEGDGKSKSVWPLPDADRPQRMRCRLFGLALLADTRTSRHMLGLPPRKRIPCAGAAAGAA